MEVGEGREGRGKGRDRVPKLLLNQAPPIALLRHCCRATAFFSMTNRFKDLSIGSTIDKLDKSVKIRNTSRGSDPPERLLLLFFFKPS